MGAWHLPRFFGHIPIAHAQRPLFLNFCTGIIFTKFQLDQPVHSWLIAFILLIRYVTLWPWPWPWNFVKYRLSHGQIWAKSNNPWLNYSGLNIENLRTVRGLGFYQKWTGLSQFFPGGNHSAPAHWRILTTNLIYVSGTRVSNFNMIG